MKSGQLALEDNFFKIIEKMLKMNKKTMVLVEMYDEIVEKYYDLQQRITIQKLLETSFKRKV